MFLCFLHPNPPRSKEGGKNEKISDSSIRHRYHRCNLCLAGSGSLRRRLLIIDPTISFYCETKKNTGPVTCVFLWYRCDRADGVSWEQESARIADAAGRTLIERFLISIEIYIM